MEPAVPPSSQRPLLVRYFISSCAPYLLLVKLPDNGCGIPKEQINDLFTGYLDRKGTRADCKKSNMGIGLSVCAAIVKAHGGSITAANRENGGAEFRFDLSMEG